MGVKLYAMTCGTLTGALANLMEGGEGEVILPIPAYLIEHPKGTVLFDSGMHPDCQRDPAGRAGARIGEWFKFDYHPGDEVSARLAAIGRDPAKIDILINSHLHFDHVGGNALIPNATVVVQKPEWDAGMDPDMAALRGFNRRDFDLGHQVRRSPASTISSATAASSPFRPMATRRATNRSSSSSNPATSFWPPMPAISAVPCRNAACRSASTIARRCAGRSTRWRGCKLPARGSSSVTTANSGRRCRRVRRRSPRIRPAASRRGRH
jgi:hypothetical protein